MATAVGHRSDRLLQRRGRRLPEVSCANSRVTRHEQSRSLPLSSPASSLASIAPMSPMISPIGRIDLLAASQSPDPRQGL